MVAEPVHSHGSAMEAHATTHGRTVMCSYCPAIPPPHPIHYLRLSCPADPLLLFVISHIRGHRVGSSPFPLYDGLPWLDCHCTIFINCHAMDFLVPSPTSTGSLPSRAVWQGLRSTTLTVGASCSEVRPLHASMALSTSSFTVCFVLVCEQRAVTIK